MRYLIVVFFFICFVFQGLSLSVLADDDLDSLNDTWDSVNTNKIDNAIMQQKPVSDEEFNKTVQQLREQRKKKKFKFFWQSSDEGQPLTKPSFMPKNAPPEVDTNDFMSVQDIVKTTPTIMIPTDVITEYGSIVSAGFYKLSIQKIQDDIYNLLLIQGPNVVAKVNAYKTDEEFSPNELNFAKALLLKDRIKLIYGSLDLNLEGYLKVKNKY